MKSIVAVVPGYYLVCYNYCTFIAYHTIAVAVSYTQVCYNHPANNHYPALAVVPGYYLVCYNYSALTLNVQRL
mgnify:FL=1